MANNCFEFPIPAPLAQAFTNGEKAVGPLVSINGGAGNATYHLARYIYLEGGLYTVTLLARSAASLWAGADASSMAMLFTTQFLDGALTLNVSLPRGFVCIDVMLQDMQGPGGPLYFALAIKKGGVSIYSSSATGWKWANQLDFDDEIAPTASDYSKLPVFSILPNWQAGVLERLAWLTDILTSESLAEQRRSLRLYPRRSFEASFMRQSVQRSRLDALFASNGRGACLVPLWHEAYKTAGLAAGSTTLSFPAGTLAMREFRANDVVFVSTGDPDRYELLTVQSVNLNTDTLTWATGPTATWPKGTRVWPMRVMKLTDMPTLSNRTDRVGMTSLRFEIESNDDDFSPSWNYCAPLFRFKPDRATDIQVAYEQSLSELDNGVAVPQTTRLGERSIVSQRLSLTLFGREQLFSLRSFMSMARGRAVRFYMPSFTHDLEPVDDIDGMYIDVRSFGFAELMQRPLWARRIIAIEYRDGRPTVYRQIANIEPGNGYDRLNMAQYVPPSQRDEILRIGFVMPVRFDQDSFEIKHVSDDAAAVTTALVVRSVDGDGMEPIECFVTSRPYPLLIDDGLDLTVILTGGQIYSTEFPEGVDLSVSLSGGTLRSVLQNYQADAEGIDFQQPSFASGTLRSIVLSTSLDSDAFEIAIPTLSSGTLAVKLISYTADTESFELALPTLSGGTLQ